MSLADASAAASVVLGVIVISTERAAGTAAVACIFSCTICTSVRPHAHASVVAMVAFARRAAAETCVMLYMLPSPL